LAGIYSRFFQFPTSAFTPDWSIAVAAGLIGIVAGAAGALGAVTRGVALPPAEAMRPEAPARFRHGPFERLARGARPSPQTRVIARNLERRPLRTAMAVLGLALAGGLVITVQSMFDAVNYMKIVQFHLVDRADVTVVFRDARQRSALTSIARLEGVLGVEGFRTVPIRLRSGGRTQRTVLFALPPSGELRRVVDMSERVHEIPPEGLLLSQGLARQLGAGRGDPVTVEWLEGKRWHHEVVIAGTVEDILGSAAYMSMDALQALEGGDRVLSGAYLRTDPRATDALYRRLKQLPAVSGVSVRDVALRGFDETIAESFRISLVMTLGFACVIAFGIVYNSARVALSERGRELASLRILGFTRREVATMLLGEQAVLIVLSLPFAFLTAWGLTLLIAVRFESELFRMPVIVEPQTYIVGAAIVGIAGLLSAVAVRRRVDRLDLVAVLKTRE
jgi:putative ABC transport system permease protein